MSRMPDQPKRGMWALSASRSGAAFLPKQRAHTTLGSPPSDPQARQRPAVRCAITPRRSFALALVHSDLGSKADFHRFRRHASQAVAVAQECAPAVSTGAWFLDCQFGVAGQLRGA